MPTTGDVEECLLLVENPKHFLWRLGVSIQSASSKQSARASPKTVSAQPLLEQVLTAQERGWREATKGLEARIARPPSLGETRIDPQEPESRGELENCAPAIATASADASAQRQN